MGIRLMEATRAEARLQNLCGIEQRQENPHINWFHTK